MKEAMKSQTAAADALAKEMLRESGIKIEKFNRKRRVEGRR
jgi:hypothetical protein